MGCTNGRSHALIALSIKRVIIPHICSCRIAKDIWDTLATMYHGQYEACAAYLRKQLESKIMLKKDSMEDFLTKTKDLKELLIDVVEIVVDSSLV